jgi:FtsH-binding integral membrane protein
MFPDPSRVRRPFELDYAQAGERVVARFMNMVYAWMCAGLATTAVVAWYVAQSGLYRTLASGGLIWLLFIVELALVVVIARAVNKISAPIATAMFLAYAAINGVVLSGIFLIYSLPTLGGAFAVTAGMFGVTSIYGFVTKRDLTRLGSFLFMALIGLILASVVNYYFASSTLYWIVTYAGILIFLGLTAFDTQKLKQMAYQVEGSQAMAARMSIVGSLVLYLDFINLFLFIVQLLGNRQR